MFHNSILDNLLDDDLTFWCDKDPENRYPQIAAAIHPIVKCKETDELKWKPIIYSIFERAPDLVFVFKCLARTIMPTIISGSEADIIKKRSELFRDLYEHENEAVQVLAKEQFSVFLEKIKKELEREERYRHERNERFE
jgi:hypothetical protein